MKIINTENRIELYTAKDRDEVVLGCILLLAGIMLMYAIPQVYYQEWSYRFGLVTKKWRICLSIFAALMSMFCITGAIYNLFVRVVYVIDLAGKTFSAGMSLFRSRAMRTYRFDEIDGVIHRTEEIASGKVRRWIGLQLKNSVPLYFDESLDCERNAAEIIRTITAATSIPVLDSSKLQAGISRTGQQPS